MVSRACVVDTVRVAAFAFHAVMAIVVATLLFTCRTQMYTNTGYHVMVVDWQVRPAPHSLYLIQTHVSHTRRTGGTGAA